MNDSRYLIKSGKKLRTGYTTGSCAAAAAKAAAWMLKNQKPLERVTIDTPKGWVLTLDVCELNYDLSVASCCIIKDSGDDPDITNGMPVWATVRLIDEPDIIITGGEGVGIVTQRGLQVPVGEAAINPVPKKMIIEEVRKVYEKPQGIIVMIDLPEGERLAKRTFNPKLGISGGLSILGTSGIVEPMSEEALKDTITLELKVLKEKGFATVILVPGNIGQKLLTHQFSIGQENMVKMSNYLGHALEQCVDLGFKQIIIGGHLGKLVKPAGGIYYTHSRISSTRMEILTANLVLVGMKIEDLIAVMNCRTTDEAIVLIRRAGMESVFKLLANKAADNCKAYCFDQLEVGVALFSMEDFLCVSDGFEKILEVMGDEQS